MIEISAPDKFDVCSSCGTEADVYNISIRRSEDSNATTISLCGDCRELVGTMQLIVRSDR